MGDKWYTGVPLTVVYVMLHSTFTVVHTLSVHNTQHLGIHTQCLDLLMQCLGKLLYTHKRKFPFTLPHVHIIVWLTTFMTVDWPRKESEALLGQAYIGLQGDCQHSVMYILPYTPLFKLTLPWILPTTHEQLVYCMQFARG